MGPGGFRFEGRGGSGGASPNELRDRLKEELRPAYRHRGLAAQRAPAERVYRPRAEPPSVTPCSNVTLEPILTPRPMTSPVVWVSRRPPPISAPGWMSAPERK